MRIPVSLAILATALLPACSGAQTPPAAAAAPVQENRAVIILREMSQYLGSQKQLTMKVHDWVDKIDEEGRLVSFNHERTVRLQRPDKLRIDVTGSLENEVIFYDGKQLIFSRPDDAIHSVLETPATIDETVAMLREKYGVRRPLAELCLSDLAGRIIPNITSAEFIGLTMIDGKVCTHLLFTAGTGVELQVWVEDDDTPAPVRVQVIYANVAEAPRYTIDFRSVEPTVAEAAAAFAYEPAANSEKVPFEAPAAPGAAEKKP